jgi:hypothetical protein
MSQFNRNCRRNTLRQFASGMHWHAGAYLASPNAWQTESAPCKNRHGKLKKLKMGHDKIIISYNWLKIVNIWSSTTIYVFYIKITCQACQSLYWTAWKCVHSAQLNCQ